MDARTPFSEEYRRASVANGGALESADCLRQTSNSGRPRRRSASTNNMPPEELQCFPAAHSPPGRQIFPLDVTWW
jgi:hypothetical protein